MVNSCSETIHVAYSIWDLSDSYNAIAAVAIVSLLENTNSNVIIHLLYDKNLHVDSLSYSENLQKYLEVESKYNCEIVFHHVQAPEWLHTLPAVRFFSFGTFLRLFIPEILENVIRVIYLDCDVCVNTDIKALWGLNLDGKSIGADTSKFNAGVLVMDLERIRRNHNLSKEALIFLNEHPRTPYLDQDALQYVFKDDICFFDRMFNLTTSFHNDWKGKEGIFHYTWTKPWKIYVGGEWSELLFWEYYSKTPWANLPSLVSVLASCSNLSILHATLSAERLLYYPFKYRLSYMWKFVITFIRIHFRELKVLLQR